MNEINPTWKTKILITGTIVGALLGASTAYLLARTSEAERGGPPEVSATQMLTLGISAIGLVRGIAQLGSR